MIPEYTKLNRFGADCHLLQLDPAKFRFQVTNIGFQTVSQAAAMTGAEIVVNGDGWGLPGVAKGKPNSICYSDGRAIQTKRYSFRPWVNFSREGRVSFNWRNPYGLYNAVSGDRYLMAYGVFNIAIRDRHIKNARTVIGVDKSGIVLLMVVDGWDVRPGYEPQGLTFPEIGSVLAEFNCETAINLDGGGSSAMAIQGQIVNQPNDDGVFGERAVVNHLAVYRLR